MRTLILSAFLAALPGVLSPVQAQIDFGDAPASYGTLVAGGGPGHPVSQFIHLGPTVDGEPDGQPSPASLGDDNLGSDDEDGVTVTNLPTQGAVPWQTGAWTQVKVNVSLTNPISEAGLDGWVDFNRNGTFDLPAEQVFTNVRLADIGNKNDGNGHTLGVWVPYTAVPGLAAARFRLSVPGGMGPNGVSAQPGEVEDYMIQIVRASTPSSVSAWARHGQVWVTWDFDPAAPAQAYEIYRSNTSFSNVADATLVARLFPQEYAAGNLVAELQEAFGAAARLNFTIPAENPADPDTTLAVGRGLCVETVRGDMTAYYAVVPRGMQTVPAAAITGPLTVTAAVAGIPRMHPQQSGLAGDGTGSQYRISVLNMWVDGGVPGAPARPDFPLMASAARRCTPHIYILMSPEVVPTSVKPLTIAAHGGNGRATMWLPGGEGWRNTGCAPSNGYLFALEDRLYQIVNGMPQAFNTAYLGYVASMDPFDNVQEYEGMLNRTAPQQLPPANAEIQPYTIIRQNWVLDRLLADALLNIDANRVSIFGHSAGGKGSLNWSRTYPERFAAVVSFNAEMGNNLSLGPDVGRFGYPMLPPDETGAYGPPRANVSPGQNLRVAGLTTRTGAPVHFNDFYDMRTEIHPGRDLPPMQLWYGLREDNWSVDFDHTVRPDVQEIMEYLDVRGTGATLYWDLRNHGVDKWNFLPGSGFSIQDHWVPSPALQTRRDDANTLTRFRRNESYPVFHRVAGRPGHDDPGRPDYGVTPPFFDTISPWTDPTPSIYWESPEVTGGDYRGTWGGWMDWYSGLPATDLRAPRDLPNTWAASLFLTADQDGAGNPLTPTIDNCPAPFLLGDVAIRRPQLFLPAAGTGVEWMSCDQATRRVLQSGRISVAADTVVRLPSILVPRSPGAVRVVAATQMDFGDAPSQYPVTLADEGARHAGDGLLFLGTGRTVESEGTPHGSALLAAEGDDGVTGPAQWVPGSVVTLTVSVSAACRLDAWVDWTHNNSWDGQGADLKDQVAASLRLNAGANMLKILVPSDALPGVTYARFRVSLGGMLAPTGPAPDGEVEDYPVLIAAAPGGDGLEPVTITKEPNGDSVLHWTGRADWDWQIEYSSDMVEWTGVYLPAAGTAGAMSAVIPPELMAGPRKYFRVRFGPLVNAPVQAKPGAQRNLSFVHENGTRSWDTATNTWRVSTISRNYHIYVPAGWNPARTWPLILMLHGHGMTGAVLAATQSELRGIASDRGFITVFPDGNNTPESTAWHSYPDPALTSPASTQLYSDDKAFLFALLNYLMNDTGLRVDSSRLYCAGFSNGGSMTHFISSDAAHPFRAFGIMESGLPFFSHYEPRVFYDFTSGALLPAKPRPCILMNMINSEAWPYEGKLVINSEGLPVDSNNDGINDRRPGSRGAMERWLTGNGLTGAPVVSRHAFVNPGTTAADFPGVENHFLRPDAWWPASRKIQYAAAYAELTEPEIPNSLREPVGNLAPSWFENPANWQNISSYPHLTFEQNRLTYTVAGTWSEETWATPSGQSDREVKFFTLSDGGHQWPGASDKVGWDAQLGVMDFFTAH